MNLYSSTFSVTVSWATNSSVYIQIFQTLCHDYEQPIYLCSSISTFFKHCVMINQLICFDQHSFNAVSWLLTHEQPIHLCFSFMFPRRLILQSRQGSRFSLLVRKPLLRWILKRGQIIMGKKSFASGSTDEYEYQIAQLYGTARNRDVSTRPFTHTLASLLQPPISLFALSLACSLAHSLPNSWASVLYTSCSQYYWICQSARVF